MPSNSTMPASGILKCGKVAAMTTSDALRHAGDPLGREQQNRHQQDLLGDAQLDTVHLRDEHDRERAVHHRAVEIERVAHRQHEARDAVAATEALQFLQRFRIGGFGARGRKRQNRRLAHPPDELHDPRADDQAAEHDQYDPQLSAGPDRTRP